MEEKIYQRQVNKQSLSQRVLDEHQLDRHFTSQELADLYRFEPDVYTGTSERPIMPKDDLLKQLLLDCKQWIHKYHEHDSLLENKLDQGLSEEERKLAWEEYEHERTYQTSRAAMMQSFEVPTDDVIDMGAFNMLNNPVFNNMPNNRVDPDYLRRMQEHQRRAHLFEQLQARTLEENYSARAISERALPPPMNQLPPHIIQQQRLQQQQMLQQQQQLMRQRMMQNSMNSHDQRMNSLTPEQRMQLANRPPNNQNTYKR